MPDWKQDRIASALDATNPTVLTRMKSGFAVFGDTQFLPGYCVLLSYPKVFSLNDLSPADRAVFLTDMVTIGDVLIQTLNPLRINYEILGNTDTYLHAHIFPRYEWEEESYRKEPVWLYPSENWSSGEYHFTNYWEIKAQIQNKLCEMELKHG